jgi:two-component system, NarL family, response regulator LiaR
MTNEGNTIRVMIVDDHDMVRSGLEVFIETFEDLEFVGEANNGEDAVRLCEQLKPDVILMDLKMPRMDGVTAIATIRQAYPGVQIIALTSFKDKNMVHSALQAGAIGYLLKNASIDELATAIRSAKSGRSTLSPEATQALIEATTQPPPPGHDLTERELEVLALMVDGLNNREIADSLTISRSTVKNHVSNILSKLGVSSRTEAVAMAVEYQLVIYQR